MISDSGLLFLGHSVYTSKLTAQTFPVLAILTIRFQVLTHSFFVKWIWHDCDQVISTALYCALCFYFVLHILCVYHYFINYAACYRPSGPLLFNKLDNLYFVEWKNTEN